MWLVVDIAEVAGLDSVFFFFFKHMDTVFIFLSSSFPPPTHPMSLHLIKCMASFPLMIIVTYTYMHTHV